MKDLIIIGAGPAGLSAAVYAARKQLDFSIISVSTGGQVGSSSCVENYLGLGSMSGMDIVRKFLSHAKEYGITICHEKVQKIEKEANMFVVRTDKAAHEARAVLVATGKKPRRLGLASEDRLDGSGVAYCAVCDGPHFKGKDIAIIGGGNCGFDAAISLGKIAGKIDIIEFMPKLAADQILIDKAKCNPRLSIHLSSKVVDILGEECVEGVVIEHEAKQRTIPVQGVFVQIGYAANSEFLQGFLSLSRSGEIVVDEKNMTSVSGIFAAGDITNRSRDQVIIAAGDGAAALLHIWDYLVRQKNGC